MKRPIGVSAVSFFPWCLGSGGPQRTIEMATKAGFSGIQALPIQGWRYENFQTWENGVISYEDAWNFGSLWQATRRLAGQGKADDPSWLDLLLFGEQEFPGWLFQKAIYSVHEFRTGGMLEIHPEFSTDPDVYKTIARSQGSTKWVCWDTWHTRRVHKETGERIAGGNWETLMSSLVNKIGLIHVHPTREELRSFLDGTNMELNHMLTMLGIITDNDVPVIIEVFPPCTTPRNTIECLKELLNVTQKILKYY